MRNYVGKIQIKHFVFIGVLMMLTGCSQPVGIITNGSKPLEANEDSAVFLDRVSEIAAVSQNDASRGILLLLDGKDEAKTFTQRVEQLRSREVMNTSWTAIADSPVTRGKLAYMVFQACKMRGGLILKVAGPSERYCMRELRYKGFIHAVSPWANVSGMEFVSIMRRVDKYIRTGVIPADFNQWQEEDHGE